MKLLLLIIFISSFSMFAYNQFQSMNAKNAAGLLAMPNIDGGLIGGASLKGEDFTTIINACK